MSYKTTASHLALLIALLPQTAHADNAVESPKCKEAIGAIVRLTNAKIDHASPSGDNMFFSHPGAGEIVLFCGPITPLGVSASVETAYPSQAYYSFLGKAGSVVVGADPSQVERAAVVCQGAALVSQDEASQSAIGAGSIECQAYTRDGGGTTIDINAKK